MRDRGIRPELEVFDAGMAYVAGSSLDQGILGRPLREPDHRLGQLGAGRRGRAGQLVYSLPPGTTWPRPASGPPSSR